LLSKMVPLVLVTLTSEHEHPGDGESSLMALAFGAVPAGFI
jgi:hypothetical protein